MLTLVSCKESRTFGQEVDGQTRYTLVCSFAETSRQSSRFAASAFGSSDVFQKSVDLLAYYPKSKPNGKIWEGYEPNDYWKRDRNGFIFNATKAVTDFEAENLQQEFPEFTGHTFPMDEISDYSAFFVAETGNRWEMFRVAEFSDVPRERVLASARRSIQRMLDAGVIEPWDDAVHGKQS